MNIKVAFQALRPKTLTAALVPIVVASALVFVRVERFEWWISIAAFLSSLFIQIGTNLINDAVDYEKGADTEDRLGPQRVTQAGLLNQKTVFRYGVISLLIATVIGIPLVLHGGLPVFIIGIFSIICAYAYTAGPFPLAYKGLGDVFVIIFFGVVAVCGVFYLHLKFISWAALIAGLQVGVLCTVLIAINNLRDIEGDAKVGKKTLPVRLGKKIAKFEIAVLVIIAFILNLFWLYKGLTWAPILPLLSFPLAYNIVAEVYANEPSELYNKFLARSSALHIVFGLLLSAGIVLG